MLSTNLYQNLKTLQVGKLDSHIKGDNMKIVINKCYGGFGVSKAIYDKLGLKWDGYGYLDNSSFGIKDNNYNAYRSDEKLIKAIEKIGAKKSSGEMAELRIVTIPDDVDWELNEYDGIETIHEVHRSWQLTKRRDV